MKMRRAPRAIGLGAIAIYRAAISPVIHSINGPACRFEPSCSEYGREAIAEYGILRGGAMAIWRIARCNPMGGHGYDPVRVRFAQSDVGIRSSSASRALSEVEVFRTEKDPGSLGCARDDTKKDAKAQMLHLQHTGYAKVSCQGAARSVAPRPGAAIHFSHLGTGRN